MELKEILGGIFQYGGTVIMAGLFVWIFISDKTKNSKLLEDNSTMLTNLSRSNDNISQSNENIAKALEIVSKSLVQIDVKVDRNNDNILRIERK